MHRDYRIPRRKPAGMDTAAALAYAERHTLHALLISAGGATVLEQYANGYDAAKPHALYSGTKSFWGVAAAAAHDDGLLDLDEPVAQTFPAWSADARRAQVTLRELLALTSGIGFGGLGSAVPTYERALETPIKDEPGERFTYGGIPLQVFGAVLARKLEPRGLTPHAYLRGACSIRSAFASVRGGRSKTARSHCRPARFSAPASGRSSAASCSTAAATRAAYWCAKRRSRRASSARRRTRAMD